MTTEAQVLRVGGLRRSVFDLDRSVAFYVDALGFAVDRRATSAFLHLGAQAVELMSGAVLRTADEPVASSAFQHLAIVTSDMDAAMARLQAFSPLAITAGGAVTLPASSGGVRAFKFRDPDHHPLELIEFQPGQGDPAWQGGMNTSSTLGIDHSAIAVSDVERSIAFYVRGLGLHVNKRQLNSGPEQARLDGLPASEVEVVSLATEGGEPMRLELLAYRTPRPEPLVAAALPWAEDRSDQLVLQVADLLAIGSRLAELGCTEFAAEGFGRLKLRDPDGHVLLLCEAACGLPPADRHQETASS